MLRRIFLVLITCLLFANCKHHHEISEEEKKEIISELAEIKRLDQKFAGMPPSELREEYGHERAWEIFELQRDSVGLINQRKIKALYEQYGYLGEQEIGKEASTDFWLPIQHADNDIPFQQEMLKALESILTEGSNDLVHYAMLEDRINVNLGRPQRFGSQLTYNNNGQAIPKYGLVDSTKVDSLRRNYLLPNFKVYYNDMTRMHFEMNKEYLLEEGITKPLLYK